VSFKRTLQALEAFWDSMRMAAPEQRTQLWEAMLSVMAYDRDGDRPRSVESVPSNIVPNLIACSLFRASKRATAYWEQLKGYYRAIRF
jgi:hypothetical protein